MAASVTLPTQALPPYLSASTFTVTEVGGAVSTGVSTVGVPITYFGPSIPLGPDDVWTFGGSTSPPSTASSTAPSTTATSAIPSTSQSTTTPSSIPSTTSSTTSSLTSPTSSIRSSGTQSSVGSTSTSAMGGSKKHLSGGAIGGIVIAAVVFVVVLITLLCLLAIRRRRRRTQQHIYENPNMSDFVIVDAEGQPRVAGEGVARPHGEEEDSFLRAGDDAPDMRERSARLVSARASSGAETIGTIPAPEGVIPTALTTGASPPDPAFPPGLGKRANSPFFHASASSLFFNPNRGPDPSVSAPATSGASKRDSASTQQSSGRSLPAIQGAIIPRHELLQMEGQWNQEATEAGVAAVGGHRGVTELGERVLTDEDYPGTPLRPPPILNPDGIRPTSRPDSAALSISDTPGSEVDERATFLTARRVRMDEAGPSTLVTRDEGPSSPSAWGASFGGLGLGGLARLSRLSWFQRMEAMRGSPGQSGSSDSDGNGAGRRSRTTSPASGLGVPRPLSHLSTGSKASRASSTGESNYHDAQSTISTGSGHGHRDNGRSSPVPPVPVRSGSTPEGAAHSPSPQRDNGNGGDGRDLPAIPEPSQPSSSPSRAQRNSQADNTLLDVLDTPVPRPTSSQFSSTSSRDVTGPMLPPGLEHLAVANVHSWRESGSDMPSPTSLTGSGGTVPFGGPPGANPDVLEDEPPRPRAGWTHLRSVAGATVDAARRATLGQSLLIDIDDNVNPIPDARHHYASERGSVQSLPTSLPGPVHGRLSPFSPVGSGGSNSHSHSHSRNTPSSFGSGSSRSHFSHDDSNSRSGHGHGSAVGGSSQLHHSSSITSGEQQRRFSRREPGEPLTSASMQSLSAFGPAPAATSTTSTPARTSAVGIRLVGSSPSSQTYGPPPDLDPDATFSTVTGATGVTSQTSMSNLSGASHHSTVLDESDQTEGQTPEQIVHMIVPIDP